MDATVKAWLCLLPLALAGQPGFAQVADPTVPPPEARSRADGAAAGPVLPAGPRLQSVLVGPKRKVAVIDGETVRLGQKHRDAVLEKITETEVVLRRGKEREVLKLFPAGAEASGAPVQRQGKQE